MNKTIVTALFWTGLIALIIAPLSLLYVDPEMFFPYITGRNFFWRFFVEIAFVSWVGCALLHTQYQISRRNPFIISLFVFMLVVLVANILGNNPYFSFWSGAERMDGYISLLHLLGYLLALVGLLQNKIKVERIILFLLGIGFYVAFLGWSQDKGRIDSVLGNPIYLSSLSLFGVFISGYFLVAQKKFLGFSQNIRMFIFSIFIVAFLYTIFRTGTRGALVGLVGGGFTTALIVAIGARADSVAKWWRYIAIVIVAVTLVLGGLFFGAREQLSEFSFIQNNLLLSRMTNISLNDTTTVHRIANWEMAIEGFKERPLLGWGQEQYGEVFSKYYNAKELYNAEQWFDRTHNTFLDWLIFAGILGLISYLGLFIVLLYILWKKGDFSFLEKSVLTGLFVGYLFQNLVAFDSLISGIFLYTCFALVVNGSRSKEEGQLVNNNLVLRYMGIGVLSLFTVWWMYYSIYIPRTAAKDFIHYLAVTRSPQTPESAEENYPAFAQVFEEETFFNRELVIQMIRNKERYLVSGSSSDTTEKYLKTILTEVDNALVQYNSPTKLNFFFGSYLLEHKANDAARTYLGTALKQSPNKPLIIIQNAILAEREGEIEKARALYEHLVSITPDYELAIESQKEFEERNK